MPHQLRRDIYSILFETQKEHPISIIHNIYAYLYPNGGYTGLDFGPGPGKKIAKIHFLPVLSLPYTMLGGSFQGSNTTPEDGYEDIYTITKTPHIGWNEVIIPAPKPFRYVRYLGPPGQHCLVSKIKYYGFSDEGCEGGGETRLKGTPFGAGPPIRKFTGYENVYKEGPEVLLSFKESANSTGCPLYVFLEKQNAGFFHQHDFVEMMYIKSGSCLHSVNNKIEYLFAGDLVIIPPFMTHAFFAGKNFQVFNILFYPEVLPEKTVGNLTALPGLSDFFSPEPAFNVDGKLFHKVYLYIARQREILTIIEGMERDFSGREPGYPISCCGFFMRLLVLLSRYFFADKQEDRGKSDSLRRCQLVDDAIAYLENNYATMEQMEELIHFLNINYTTLSHLFKKETGVSVHEYLSRVRIAHACQKLMETNDDITMIAYDAGFKNYSNFSRFFKQLIGYSPQEFRSANRI
ncbi:MAG: AraC family transcriptional regulator [Bacillota bacterium]